MDEPRFELRLADAGDRALIVELMAELFDEVAPGAPAVESKKFLDDDIARALSSPLVRIVLAFRDGQPAGVARVDIGVHSPPFRLRADHRSGYVDQMFVRPQFRKQKLGERLLSICEEWLRAQGVSHCLLHAAPAALKFYSTRGYASTRELFKKL